MGEGGSYLWAPEIGQFSSKNKIARNMGKKALQQHSSSSMQKAARKDS